MDRVFKLSGREIPENYRRHSSLAVTFDIFHFAGGPVILSRVHCFLRDGRLLDPNNCRSELEMKKCLFPIFLFALIALGSGISAPVTFADTSHCGPINSNETWSSSGNVHVITCDVTVAQGATLTITAGTVVKFDEDVSLIVNGTLQVLGSADNHVYFTSYRDDSIGGDTDGDGPSTGSPSDWARIEFLDISNDASLIEHATIRYGGQEYVGTSDYGAITLNNASPTISRTTISQNAYAGILASGSTPILKCNNIFENGYGLYNATPDVTVTAELQW